MSSLFAGPDTLEETRASGEAQDEPPSQEAQDREHAEQAQIGEQVEKQLSSPSISPSSAAHVAVPSTALTTPSRVKKQGIPKKEKKTGSLYDDPNHDMTPAANSGKQQTTIIHATGIVMKLSNPDSNSTNHVLALNMTPEHGGEFYKAAKTWFPVG